MHIVSGLFLIKRIYDMKLKTMMVIKALVCLALGIPILFFP